MKAFYKSTGTGFLCKLAGHTRQAFYANQNRQSKAALEAGLIVGLVKRERKIAKRVGGKRLYLILKDELIQHKIVIGRDKFFDILRINDLLVKRRRRKVRTTMSNHKLKKYPNLAKDLKIDKAEQLWVTDITYIRVGEGFCYLILITDAYSRKVVGYRLSRTLEAAFCVDALKEALKNRVFPDRILMHHSDRGVQYCSIEYILILKSHDICISMTENGDPLENALAERMNGIFKENFGLDDTFESFEHVRQVIADAVEYYNNRLPHSSVDMLTPSEAHYRTGTLKKTLEVLLVKRKRFGNRKF